MSSILLKCIQKFMGDRNYTILQKEEMTTLLFTNDYGIDRSIMLSPTMTFQKFKQFFIRCNKSEDSDCPVCYEDMRCGFACFNCKRCICLRCYLRMLEHNRGVTKCPICRFEDGEEILDDKELDIFLDKTVAEYKRKIKLYINSFN